MKFLKSMCLCMSLKNNAKANPVLWSLDLHKDTIIDGFIPADIQRPLTSRGILKGEIWIEDKSGRERERQDIKEFLPSLNLSLFTTKKGL